MKSLGYKKGQANLIGVVLLFIVFLIVFGMLAFYVFPSFNDLNDDIQSDSDFNSDMKNTVNDLTTRYPAWADGVFIVFYVMIILIFIALPHFETSPVFFVAIIIVFAIILIIGMNISNAHEEAMQDDDMSPYINTFPKTYWIMTHLLECFLVIFVFFGISIYVKTR